MTEVNTESNQPIPITILAGFLGSGKTTLLNHILAANHGLRVGVIVNEFGDISIDDKLITNQQDDVIELANGCVCCTMQGDLLRALQQVFEAQNQVEYILVETTGLADPLPIARSLTRPELQALLRLDGIITMVDAANFDRNLDYAEVAYNQMVYGDILLVNKADLVDERTLDLIDQGIRKINSDARILRSVNAAVDLHLLLDVGVFRLEQRFGQEQQSSQDHHEHDHAASAADFRAVSYRQDHLPISAEKFQAFMRSIPVEVFRGKGILNVAGEDYRMIFHQVGDRLSVTPGESWRPDERRGTELVFIGKGIDQEDLIRRLEGCLASPD
jgi:G3E family GTPase